MSWNLKIRQMRNGWSLRRIARRAGVCDKTVANLEEGRGTMHNLILVVESGLYRNVAEIFRNGWPLIA